MSFQLKCPVKPYHLNQEFGDNKACVSNGNGPISSRKVITRVGDTCPLGYTSLYKALGLQGHSGADLRAGHGQTLYSSCNGIVEEIQTEVERGLGVGVITEEKYWFPDGDFNIKVRYWHLMSIAVKKGQKVQTGDILGLCDNTGASSGDHLHFEVKRVKQNSNGVWYNIDQDNGYNGGIDPIQFMDGTFAVDCRILLLTKLLELTKKLLSLIR